MVKIQSWKYTPSLSDNAFFIGIVVKTIIEHMNILTVDLSSPPLSGYNAGHYKAIGRDFPHSMISIVKRGYQKMIKRLTNY